MQSYGDAKPGAPRKSSSIYSNELSMESLIQQVSEMKRVEELKSIEILMKDNQRLRIELRSQYQLWRVTMSALQVSTVGARMIRRSLREFNDREVAAERKLLAYWGINTDTAEAGGPGPPFI